MGKDSKIAWTDHTFSPWWGCSRVSPGCAHCYAESLARRWGHDCFGYAQRRTFGPKHWNEPRTWAAKARKIGGRRERVFCASMCDVFEFVPGGGLDVEREKLWPLIRETSDALDWLLLTKRPTGVLDVIPADVLPLVWLGVTVEDAAHMERVEQLLRIPDVRCRFVSFEPLLERIPASLLGVLRGIDWAIVGGESGPGARPFDLTWAEEIDGWARKNGVVSFAKQAGSGWRARSRRGGSGCWRWRRWWERSERRRAMAKDVKLFTRYRDDGMDEMTLERLLPDETDLGHGVLIWCRGEDLDAAGICSVEEAGITLSVEDARELILALEQFVRGAESEEARNG